MSKKENSKKYEASGEFHNEPARSVIPQRRNVSEQSDIEQARLENRREADLDDKTPAGDAGVEDNEPEGEYNDSLGEINY